MKRILSRSRLSPSRLSPSRLPPRGSVIAGAALAAAAATAFWVELRSRRAEREHPARGRFVEVDGVRLHYVERGTGTPVVLLHGNAVSLEDFEASRLIARLARDHRVIAIDRPGFGHSTRPRDRLWTPATQAELIHQALAAIGAVRPTIVGHSMGAMVAMRLALDHPLDVDRLVLLGGYYYPSFRVDALMTAPVALPVLGDALRYTVTAISARLGLKAAVAAMFAPKDAPRGYIATVSREMMVRPSQIRANAEDAAAMIPAAAGAAKRHRELTMPVSIFAGEDDLVVDPIAHSKRLHDDVPQSTLSIVPGTGHMVHHAAMEQIATAIG
jgi:pimeloyl-ACP methyl ester carboxylesterase